MAITMGPPKIGLPEGTKESGKRVDLKKDDFDLLIEMHGYRLVWTRAAKCPCNPVSPESEGQPDPNCTKCKGLGVFWFGTVNRQVEEDIGELSTLQQQVLDRDNGMLIHGIVTTANQTWKPLDQIGRWDSGTMRLTVRSENKIGFWDRLTAIDAYITFSEVLKVPGDGTLPTSYPAAGVNLLASVSQDYVWQTDYTLDTGVIKWVSGREPATDTRITAHYLCNPVWLVSEYPHLVRTSKRQKKQPVLQTPRGNIERLPIQAMMRYEFLGIPK